MCVWVTVHVCILLEWIDAIGSVDSQPFYTTAKKRLWCIVVTYDVRLGSWAFVRSFVWSFVWSFVGRDTLSRLYFGMHGVGC